MQRSAELYEDLVKCCCGDAMSEVQICFAVYTFVMCRSTKLYMVDVHILGEVFSFGHIA